MQLVPKQSMEKALGKLYNMSLSERAYHNRNQCAVLYVLKQLFSIALLLILHPLVLSFKKTFF